MCKTENFLFLQKKWRKSTPVPPCLFPKYMEGLFHHVRTAHGTAEYCTTKRRLESSLLCKIENFRFFRKLPGKNVSPITEIYGGTFFLTPSDFKGNSKIDKRIRIIENILMQNVEFSKLTEKSGPKLPSHYLNTINEQI